MLEKLNITKEFFQFLWKRKLWWLIPIILIFLIVGVLVLFVSSSPLAPFVYPLF